MPSPSPAAVFGSLFSQRVVVGVGDLAVSNQPAATLVTYALGSCVGVILHDAAVPVSGLLHLMLPDSALAPAKAVVQPAMFADTGLKLLVRNFQGLRGDPRRARVFLAGGANVLSGSDSFRIGERNITAVAAHLRSLGLRSHHEELGGTVNRTIAINVATGEITMRTPQGQFVIQMP